MAQVQQPTAAQNAQSAMAANIAARQAVLTSGYPMLQQIFAANVNPASQTVLNIPPQNVGLIKGFLVEIVATFTVGATNALAITPMGAANLVQNFTFQDLQNYQRINTTGWHMHFVNTAKQGDPFFDTRPSDSPVGYGSGNLYPVMVAPSAPAGGATGQTIRMFYWVPLAYSDSDLTGSIYAGVVNATMNLQMTLATSAQFAITTGDPANAVYTGNTATVTNYAVTVYQSYIDQLPINSKTGMPVLPAIDINTIYEFKQTPFSGMTANSDFYFPYSNFRHFMSTTLVFDNGASWASISPGSDVNYWSFRTANYTDTRKADPFVWKGKERQIINNDFPREIYYFDHRSKPIYTTQTGNTALVGNFSTVNTGATATVGWEMLANVTNLVNAGSLAANG
jgi:hypothetical protein